ncbi:MAG: hypothetical protein IPO55_13505 [Alphaproteobacteria bacterium]|nr:hypothetical protein [Alphaproteobacteria bacterium]
MILWLFSYWVQVSSHFDSGSEAEKLGAAIGTSLGTGFIMMTWTLGVIILGIPVLLTKGKIVEIIETAEFKNRNSSKTGFLLFILMAFLIFLVAIFDKNGKTDTEPYQQNQTVVKPAIKSGADIDKKKYLSWSDG